MIVLELVQNTALLVALAVIYDLLWRRIRSLPWAFRLVSGLLFGAVTVLGMLMPLHFAAGVIYDGRSIILSVAAYVAGPIPGLVAGLIAAAYRLALGGVGVLPGVLTIATSVGIGGLFHLLRRRSKRWERTSSLILLGISVHVVMVAFQFLLPDDLGISMLRKIGFVVLILYPAAVVLIVRLFLDREKDLRRRMRLARSELRYRSIFEHSSLPMLLIDPDDGRIVDANSSAEALYGWTVSQLRSMNIGDINLAGTATVGASMQDARRADGREFEFTHRRSDGSVVPVQVFSGPISVEDRQLLFSTIHDVSARRAAERDLYLSRYCIESAVLDVLQVREDDQIIVAANRSACRNLGYEESELVGMSLFEIDPTMTPEGLERDRGRVRLGVDTSFETVRRRKDGSIFPAEVTVSYVEYEGVEYGFSFARDITDRKKATSDLHSSIREKETLLREIHHRVKNNLAVVAGLLGLQMDRVVSPERAMEALQKSRDRISAMAEIHSLLYEVDDVNAVNMTEYLERLIWKLAGVYADGADLDIRCALEPIEVGLDTAVPLGLVCNEVLTNALKHGLAGRPNGSLTVELVSADGRFGELRVADDGPGFDPMTVEEGLGMQLVHLLCGQIRCLVEIESTAGTVVHIRPMQNGESRLK